MVSELLNVSECVSSISDALSVFLLSSGNELFCEVESEFAQDSFNLTGLQHLIPYFDYALDMILDVEAQDAMSDDQQEMIENDAENLFGLIHARYILTTRGLQAMLEKVRGRQWLTPRDGSQV
jgi:casein kinase II subunit beta